MNAAMIERVMSAIPERAAWTHTGTGFVPHDGQGEQVKYVAQFLQWLSPLTALTKDDQRALGLLTTHQRPIEDDAELDDAVEPDEASELTEEVLADFDPDATLPPPPAREEEPLEAYATTT